MKKNYLFAFTAAILFSGCASTKNALNENQNSLDVYIPEIQEKLLLNKNNKELGYQLTENGKKIIFVFDAKLYKISTVSSVYVEGSFNGWSKNKDESWKMTFDKKNKVWLLEKESSLVKIPGNSGHPEFKFYILKKPGAFSGDEPAAISTKTGYQMSTNNLVLFPEDDPKEIAQNAAIADTVKKLSDFNLDSVGDCAVLSNVRLVPGTNCLYRGYHPYKKSRGYMDTEEKRIEIVKKLLEENHVQSIITLSGNEKPSEALGEKISDYQQKIIDKGNNLFIDTSYNVVYYHSTEKDFGEVVGTIVKFITTHPGPYYIHCRLGTDRTGTLSAALAALAGADWNSIAEDYQKTNNMGIKEFRDFHLLQYSFEQILGKPISEVKDFQAEYGKHFVEGGYVTEQELSILQERLTTKNSL